MIEYIWDEEKHIYHMSNERVLSGQARFKCGGYSLPQYKFQTTCSVGSVCSKCLKAHNTPNGVTASPEEIERATKLTEERGKEYGHPLDSFDRVAKIKAVIADCKDPEIKHALDMMALKMVRLIETPDHADSIDDISGYAETMRMIHRERAKRQYAILKPEEAPAEPEHLYKK